jgi:hypothetical protein
MKLDAFCLGQVGLSKVVLGGRFRIAVERAGQEKSKQIAQSKSSRMLCTCKK